MKKTILTLSILLSSPVFNIYAVKSNNPIKIKYSINADEFNIILADALHQEDENKKFNLLSKLWKSQKNKYGHSDILVNSILDFAKNASIETLKFLAISYLWDNKESKEKHIGELIPLLLDISLQTNDESLKSKVINKLWKDKQTNSAYYTSYQKDLLKIINSTCNEDIQIKIIDILWNNNEAKLMHHDQLSSMLLYLIQQSTNAKIQHQAMDILASDAQILPEHKLVLIEAFKKRISKNPDNTYLKVFAYLKFGTMFQSEHDHFIKKIKHYTCNYFCQNSCKEKIKINELKNISELVFNTGSIENEINIDEIQSNVLDMINYFSLIIENKLTNTLFGFFKNTNNMNIKLKTVNLLLRSSNTTEQHYNEIGSILLKLAQQVINKNFKYIAHLYKNSETNTSYECGFEHRALYTLWDNEKFKTNYYYDLFAIHSYLAENGSSEEIRNKSMHVLKKNKEDWIKKWNKINSNPTTLNDIDENNNQNANNNNIIIN
jgi:hypothetical protein